MTPDYIGDLIYLMAFLSGFCFLLGIGGLIADYVFPHIPFIQRWLDSLPDYEEDE